METPHPYIDRRPISTREQSEEAIARLNSDRGGRGAEAVEVTYYFSVDHDGPAMGGLEKAADMVLQHGTLKPWHDEGNPSVKKPAGYDDYMSWAVDLRLLDSGTGWEAGLVDIAYPLPFFDTREDGRVPLSQIMMAVASEPFSAFSFYRAARLVDIRFPPSLRSRFPGQRWPHGRVRKYLGLGDDEPLIGTIVKPKTGLTPELFSRAVLEAARAGAGFTKADENMHLSLKDVTRFVGRVARDLRAAGFDLGRGKAPRGRRFLFAPHISTDADQLEEYSRAALEAGANALMFSPYYSGGFLAMSRIIETHDVPVYAHTAGMNVMTGSPSWGIDPAVMYVLSGLFGAAFMQLTTMNGYLRPLDVEKPGILQALRRNGLEGADGMTLAIAGGLGPAVMGKSMETLGRTGRMFLAGTSVYSHPDGPGSGVKALIAAYKAYNLRGITDEDGLRSFAAELGGDQGRALARALAQKALAPDALARKVLAQKGPR